MMFRSFDLLKLFFIVKQRSETSILFKKPLASFDYFGFSIIEFLRVDLFHSFCQYLLPMQHVQHFVKRWNSRRDSSKFFEIISNRL